MLNADLSRRVLDKFRSLDFYLRAVCVTIVLFCALQVAVFSFGRDQTIYAAVADGILHGELPYRDRWDFKPPGIFLIFALAQALFGKVMWGPRLLEAAALIASGWAMVQLSKRFFADDRPGYLGAALAALVHCQMDFWHSGQPESFGGSITMLALWVVTRKALNRRQELTSWVACGVCFGFAFLLKPPLGGGAVICAAYLARTRSLGGANLRSALLPFLVIGGASLIPIVLCVAWFALAGGLEDLRWTFLEFTPGYTKLSWGENAVGALYFAITSALGKFSALLFFGVPAAGFGLPLSRTEREGVWLILGIIVLHLSGIALQAKFFQYHFAATLPLISFLAGLGWFKLWRQAARQGAGGAVAFGSLMVMISTARMGVTDVPLTFAERCEVRLKYVLGLGPKNRAELDEALHRAADYDLASNRRVADVLRPFCKTHASLFVWGFEPSLYWLSDCVPASRYIYNVPQRAKWQAELAQHKLLEDLKRNKPEVFVVQHHDYFRFVTGNDLDSKQALATLPELEHQLAQGYRLLKQVDDFEIYVRNDVKAQNSSN